MTYQNTITFNNNVESVTYFLVRGGEIQKIKNRSRSRSRRPKTIISTIIQKPIFLIRRKK